MNALEKEQSDRIQIIRVISTIMVIFIHVNIEAVSLKSGPVLTKLPNWLENFKFIVSSCFSQVAVPFFFLFSSVFLYSKSFTWKENINKKVKTLLIPYVLCISAYIMIFWVAQNMPIMSAYFSNPDNLISNWGIVDWLDAYVGKLRSDRPFNVPMWFVRDLIILNIFSVFILKVTSKFHRIVLCAVLLAWLFRVQLFIVDTQALFFIMGLLIVKYNIKMEALDKISWIPLSLLGIILLYLDCKYKFIIIHQISIIVYMICIVKVSKVLVMSRLKNYILSLSKYTFFIYAFHLIILMMIIKTLLRFLPQYPITQLLEFSFIPFFTVVACVLGANILIKISPRLYRLITGGRF